MKTLTDDEVRLLSLALNRAGDRLRVLARSAPGIVPAPRMRGLLERELEELERLAGGRFAQMESAGGVEETLATKPELGVEARKLANRHLRFRISIKWLRHQVEHGGDIEQLKRSVIRTLDRLASHFLREDGFAQRDAMGELGTGD